MSRQHFFRFLRLLAERSVGPAIIFAFFYACLAWPAYMMVTISVVVVLGGLVYFIGCAWKDSK